MIKNILITLYFFTLWSCNDIYTEDTILSAPRTKFFQVSRDESGKWIAGNTESYYASNINDSTPVFTIGNGALSAAVAPNGTLTACTFGDTYCHPSQNAGGWVKWKRTVVGPVKFKIEIEGNTLDPSVDWPCQTAFLGNAIPITEYNSANFKVSVIACPPISTDGQQRPRGMICEICVQNTSVVTQHGAITLHIPGQLLLKGTITRQGFNLKPGNKICFPVLLANPDDRATLASLMQKDVAFWLKETFAYWQRVTGHFTMPGDPFTAELFTRMTVASLQTGALNSKGEPAGVLFGTYPFNELDNFKDSYYAILPATQRDPIMLQPFIAWFAKYATRPLEPKYPGGITNSLGNTLNSVLLAGLYYQTTGDSNFFKDRPKLIKSLNIILQQVIASRKVPGPWLFPSFFISDGKSLGDYHTGSNVCAWRAFESFARILEEVFDDKTTASRYHEIAAHIKTDLDQNNIMDGPFGPQFIEGRDADGSVPAMIHDGEESDATLMPFYDYCTFNFPPYKNFNRFAKSTHNASFNPETQGIVWEYYGPRAKVQPAGGFMADATFPGYITCLAGCTDTESLKGSNGCLNEIRRLTDVNGMWWWWPYKRGATRGNVQRYPFECGWAEGEFGVFYPCNFLGLSYDAPTYTFLFSPPSTTGDFNWSDFPMGFDTFSLHYQNGVVDFKNSSSHPVIFIADTITPVKVSAGGTTKVIIKKLRQK